MASRSASVSQAPSRATKARSHASAACRSSLHSRVGQSGGFARPTRKCSAQAWNEQHNGAGRATAGGGGGRLRESSRGLSCGACMVGGSLDPAPPTWAEMEHTARPQLCAALGAPPLQGPKQLFTTPGYMWIVHVSWDVLRRRFRRSSEMQIAEMDGGTSCDQKAASYRIFALCSLSPTQNRLITTPKRFAGARRRTAAGLGSRLSFVSTSINQASRRSSSLSGTGARRTPAKDGAGQAARRRRGPQPHCERATGCAKAALSCLGGADHCRRRRCHTLQWRQGVATPHAHHPC